jgi:hypothetical protein
MTKKEMVGYDWGWYTIGMCVRDVENWNKRRLNKNGRPQKVGRKSKQKKDK